MLGLRNTDFTDSNHLIEHAVLWKDSKGVLIVFYLSTYGDSGQSWSSHSNRTGCAIGLTSVSLFSRRNVLTP